MNEIYFHSQTMQSAYIGARLAISYGYNYYLVWQLAAVFI